MGERYRDGTDGYEAGYERVVSIQTQSEQSARVNRTGRRTQRHRGKISERYRSRRFYRLSHISGDRISRYVGNGTCAPCARPLYLRNDRTPEGREIVAPESHRERGRHPTVAQDNGRRYLFGQSSSAPHQFHDLLSFDPTCGRHHCRPAQLFQFAFLAADGEDEGHHHLDSTLDTFR